MSISAAEVASSPRSGDGAHRRSRRRRPIGPREVLVIAGRSFAIVLGLLFALIPIYWLFSSAFKSDRELGQVIPDLYPKQLNFGQFAGAIAAPGFLSSLLLSAIVALVTTFLVLALGSFAAYAVTQWKFPGSEHFVLLTLFTQLLPQTAVIVPIYLLWESLGLVGSTGGLVLAYLFVTLPVGIWMLVGFFRSIPTELSEAGLMDGASRFRILVSIVLPVARPALAAVGVYTVISCWGEFLIALVLLTGGTQTVTVNLSMFIGEHNPNIGPLMAASAMATIPPLVLFFFLQRYFVAGLTGGAVKD